MVPPSPTILLVDPDDAGVRSVAAGLQAAGFRTEHVHRGDAAVGRFEPSGAGAGGDPPDLVLLELILPDQPGLEVCRQLRERSSVPIVIVTSIDSELDVAVALEVGADDYVIKPIDQRELLARTRGLLRRAEEMQRRRRPPSMIEVGDLRLDLSAHSVWVGDRMVALTLKEFAVLRILLERAGRIVPRRSILQQVWGVQEVGGDSRAGAAPPGRSATLDAHMKRLRSKLEGGGAANSRITTFRKLGYRYETEDPR